MMKYLKRAASCPSFLGGFQQLGDSAQRLSKCGRMTGWLRPARADLAQRLNEEQPAQPRWIVPGPIVRNDHI
jgi:hypothetical protein